MTSLRRLCTNGFARDNYDVAYLERGAQEWIRWLTKGEDLQTFSLTQEPRSKPLFRPGPLMFWPLQNWGPTNFDATSFTNQHISTSATCLSCSQYGAFDSRLLRLVMFHCTWKDKYCLAYRWVCLTNSLLTKLILPINSDSRMDLVDVYWFCCSAALFKTTTRMILAWPQTISRQAGFPHWPDVLRHLQSLVDHLYQTFCTWSPLEHPPVHIGKHNMQVLDS